MVDHFWRRNGCKSQLWTVNPHEKHDEFDISFYRYSAFMKGIKMPSGPALFAILILFNHLRI